MSETQMHDRAQHAIDEHDAKAGVIAMSQPAQPTVPAARRITGVGVIGATKPSRVPATTAVPATRRALT
jgi:hypothetical protein